MKLSHHLLVCTLADAVWVYPLASFLLSLRTLTLPFYQYRLTYNYYTSLATLYKRTECKNSLTLHEQTRIGLSVCIHLLYVFLCGGCVCYCVYTSWKDFYWCIYMTVTVVLTWCGFICWPVFDPVQFKIFFWLWNLFCLFSSLVSTTLPLIYLLMESKDACKKYLCFISHMTRRGPRDQLLNDNLLQ